MSTSYHDDYLRAVVSTCMTTYSIHMSTTYKRRNREFEAHLQQRADELETRTVVTTCAKTGRVIVLDIPYLTFSTEDDAVHFLRRVVARSLTCRQSRRSQ